MSATLTLIHEEQVRQLCAVHAVNNLLQLPSDLDYKECNQCKESDSDTQKDGERVDAEGCSTTSDECEQKTHLSMLHEWTCHGKILYRYEQKCARRGDTFSKPDKRSSAGDFETRKCQWRIATQQEFDDIAQEFTLREQILMQGDESTFLSATSSNDEAKLSSGMSQQDSGPNNKISMMQRLSSQYGTPYFGNYSLEVMVEALKRRGVELEFYRVPNEANATIHEHSKEGAEKDVDDTSSISCKCLIGFIIYKKEDNQRSASSFFTRIGSHLPIIKYFCEVGQHWYAITGVRYNQYPSQNAPERNRSNKNKGEDDNESSWSLIDSKMYDIPAFHTDKDLLDNLREVQEGGGLIFRAFASNTN